MAESVTRRLPVQLNKTQHCQLIIMNKKHVCGIKIDTSDVCPATTAQSATFGLQ